MRSILRRRTYAEEFVHAMNELAGNFTDDEDRSRNCPSLVHDFAG